jgi:cytochrome c-type protein NapB
MSVRGRRASALPLGLFLVASAVTAVAAAMVAFKRLPARHAPARVPAAVAILAAPADPIASEAQVFATRGDMLAIAAAARREREAHPRTLKTMHYLRAYSGAPPRIPHELTPDEFRTGACNTCHERGGYSPRFQAYVPVTPHPGNAQCLQCHVGTDEVMAIPLVSTDENRRCHQCHGAGGPPPIGADASRDWRPLAWPRLSTVPEETPPDIPHDLQTRGNCLACHAGPAAVAEIRTKHPEWADCRQCHVALNSEAAIFARAAPGPRAGTPEAP